MSLDWQNDVIAFHRKFVPERIGATPHIPRERVELLLRLVIEECNELVDAMRSGNLPETADAMADTIYVVLGAATTCGIAIQPVWDAVQRANMSKEGGSKREDGKILKGPGFIPPDHAAILANQGPLIPVVRLEGVYTQ